MTWRILPSLCNHDANLSKLTYTYDECAKNVQKRSKLPHKLAS
jgi:hypothetical protein